ncbi:MAG TPA: hypothetical protein P5118_09245 [Planctomycetota bacterium]|nr:hypothetical protein [Planctomycetota bacterium]
MSQAVAGQGTGGSHVWRFFRAGGFDQVRLDRGADIAALDKLDQKLWVALSCPTRGLEFDSRTLDLIDTDHDGRIRVPEIIAAAKWACANLKNPDDLVKGGEALPLAAINDATPEGKQLLASAKRILSNLGKGDAKAITIADTMDTAKIFAQTKFNGDGVVPPEAADDAATQAIVADIIACLGGETDRSGKPGVNQAKVDQFYAELAAYAAWRQKAEEAASDVLPLGEATAAAFDALKAVRAKVDDYFARCRLVAFDTRAGGVLNRAEADFAALAPKDLSASGDEVASFPLAKAEAGRPLPLGEGVNPAWAGAVAKLSSLVVAPLLGANKASITAEEWAALKAKFAPYEAWLGAKAGAAVEKLGLPRVRELLAGKGKEALTALIAQDKALEPEVNAITAVERLARYYRDLYQLLNNFVAFTDFYARERKAVFQAGTLYLDGRACELCVRVDDPGKHAALAGLSRTYLAYCDCTRKGTTEKMTIAAAFTGDDSDNLMVGRNGVFYDRKGQDWDATITKVVEQPISIRQAIWAPYKRIARMIGEQIEKMAAARDKAVTDKAAAGIGEAATKVEAAKPAAPATPFDIAKFAGIFAAIGLALGAIGTALAAIVSGFLSLAAWQMPLVILGIMVLISGPSVILAWLKLRQRNLGPILDANGWAVNARVKINIPFGGALTSVAKLPPGSERSLVDPYAQKSAARWLVPLLILIALAGCVAIWYYGYHKPAQGKPAPTVEAPAEPAPAPK